MSTGRPDPWANASRRRVYDLSSWSVAGPVEPIPLLVYERQDLPGPKPAVIYYHGVSQEKERYVDTHPVARQLADAGCLVVLPDAPGHGERPTSPTLRDRLRQSLAREFCADIEQAADEAPALLSWLAGHPGVDASRVAVAGLSMGNSSSAPEALRLRIIAGAPHWPPTAVVVDELLGWLRTHLSTG
ncbi:dienelactone hydrolase family protein [Actinopolymorpha pittospori]